MPELPDVEVFKRTIDATSLHQPIRRTTVRGDRVLGQLSAAALARRVKGRSLRTSRRHGKHLFVQLWADRIRRDRGNGGWLALHFGMTAFPGHGRTACDDEAASAAVAFRFDDGRRLAYCTQRKLGRIELTPDPARYIEEYDLGVDALRVVRERFLDLVGHARGMLKTALMNQSLIAGIGNVYSDEVLFQLGLHPRTGLRALDPDALRSVWRVMRRVLRH
ncbi:MAG: DNA-formamidopyrimidine glycosylase family protein, partial [Candidatus Eiseniibacteriota bacterium]